MKVMEYLMISRKTLTAYNKMCQPLLEKYNLSQVSFDILMFLTNNPEYKTAQDVSEIRGIKKNLVSVHVDKLVNAGLLERGFIAGDRRKVSLTCTDKSKEIIDDGLRMQNDFYEHIVSGISKEDWKAYKRITDQVIKNTLEILNK